MKKIVSMLLAVAMFCSMNLTATAAWPTDSRVKEYCYEEITAGNYEKLQVFSEDFAAVYSNFRWEFIDSTGKNPFKTADGKGMTFSYVAPFSQGKALVGEVTGSGEASEMKFSFINTNGEVTPLIKGWEEPDTKKKPIQFKVTNTESYFPKSIDERGNMKFYTYNEGYLCVPSDNGNYTVFDADGEFVCDEYNITINEEKKTYYAQEIYSSGLLKMKTKDGQISFFSIDCSTTKKDGKTYTLTEVLQFAKEYSCDGVNYSVTDVYPFENDTTCARLEEGGNKIFAVIDKNKVENVIVEKSDLSTVKCKSVKIDYIAGGAGKKAINDYGKIIYKDANDKYQIFEVEKDVKKDGAGYDELATSLTGAMMSRSGNTYTLLNADGNETALKNLDYGEIFANGTILARIGNETKLYEYSNGVVDEIRVDGMANLADIYDADAGLNTSGDRFIAIKKGEKNGKSVFGIAKLSIKETTETPPVDGNEKVDGTTTKDGMKFTDVPANAWYYADLEAAYKAELINGKTANEFKPNDNMTYAEAIKLAACLHQQNAEGKVTLGNAPEGQPWYQTYVDYCRKNGIIERNYPDYNAPAGRAGYIMIFAKALPDDNLVEINSVENNSIPDVKETDIYGHSVYKLYRAGIIGGSDTAHNCKPDDNIKRSEVATILARMMFPEKRIRFTLPEYIIGDLDETKTVKKGIDVSVTVDVKNGQKYEWQKKDGETWERITEENQTTYKNASTKTLVVTKIEEEITVRCNVLDNDGKLLVTSKTITIKVLDQ